VVVVEVRRKRRSRGRIWALVILAGGMIVGAAAWAVLVRGEAKQTVDRTIVLSMKDYAFNGNNPKLTLVPGETVRFIVRNDETDRLIAHDFGILGLDIACETHIKPGETREYVVRVPKGGDLVYACCAHKA